MSPESDEDPIRCSSTEHYDIVGVDLDWFLILGSASSIFFGFLLKIALNPPSYFTLLEKTNLMAALYATAVAIAMFVMPVIYHTSHHRKFNVDVFVFKTMLLNRPTIYALCIKIWSPLRCMQKKIW
jgi:hypothetical protein